MNVQLSKDAEEWVKAEAARRGITQRDLMQELVENGRSVPTMGPRDEVHLGSRASIPSHECQVGFDQTGGYFCLLCGGRMPNPHV